MENQETKADEGKKNSKLWKKIVILVRVSLMRK
jgi:hypothetical protein